MQIYRIILLGILPVSNQIEMAWRAANAFDLRYETPAFNEYLLASPLGPADGRMFAQPVPQQEYTHLFDAIRSALVQTRNI